MLKNENKSNEDRYNTVMPIIRHQAEVAYSAQQMYELVNDVEAYPQFLRWCKSLQIQQRYDNTVIVSIEIAKGGLHKTFMTRNTSTPFKQIVIDLVAGPIEYLSGSWEFSALVPNRCQIKFCLSFGFKTKIAAFIMQPVLNYIANTMVSAFTHRAYEVYGEN